MHYDTTHCTRYLVPTTSIIIFFSSSLSFLFHFALVHFGNLFFFLIRFCSVVALNLLSVVQLQNFRCSVSILKIKRQKKYRNEMMLKSNVMYLLMQSISDAHNRLVMVIMSLCSNILTIFLSFSVSVQNLVEFIRMGSMNCLLINISSIISKNDPNQENIFLF